MKAGLSSDVIHKEVVVVGNGPSGITLSYMLAGNVPYLVSSDHPDEFLAARLSPCVGESLVKQDLRHLADGLEGRSTNPISLLLDSLQHPCADIGFELDPLVEWRKTGKQIDHIVLGKGPPGGSWHSMDPHILTLSLGSWMSLPGLPYTGRDSTEKRAFASNVAAYYEQYVNAMELNEYFKTGVIVTNVQYIGPERQQQKEIVKPHKWVQKINNDFTARKKLCVQPERQEVSCSWSSVLNNIILKAQKKYKADRCCKRPREAVVIDNCSPDRKMREIMPENDLYLEGIPEQAVLNNELMHKENTYEIRPKRHTSRSVSFEPDEFPSCDSNLSRSLDQGSYLKHSISLDLSNSKVPYECVDANGRKPLWLVEAFDIHSKTSLTYTCNNLVLANGTSDLPNRLAMKRELKEDPHWLLHDLKSLEIELDLYMQEDPKNQDPVLIVGAGLSAADAVIVTRGRNMPVIHVFRNKSADLNKQLPENMYPEYHKVHQMMKDGGSTYPLYTAMPEYTLVDISKNDRSVILASADGKTIEIKVSFAVVLIGSRPNLSFFPQSSKLGVKKNFPIDSKNNTVDINKLNHLVNGFEGLYAVGPLAGDNFVRFLPGGALAILSDMYRRNNY